MVDYTPLVKPALKKPLSVNNKKAWGVPVPLVALIKDQLTLSSWLAVGACLQTLLYSVIGRVSLVPAFILIFYRIVDAVLIAKAYKPDPDSDGIVMTKSSVHFPDAEGKYRGSPANREVVVFLIGAKNNHPLGLLAPGWKELGDRFDQMNKDIEERAEEYDLMPGSVTPYAVVGQRATGSETMTVMYFKNVEGLHKFAHDSMHRDAWNWWNKDIAKMPHISIWHEVFRSPVGHWEGVYVNSAPRGLGAATIPITLEKDSGDLKAGETAWFSGLVDSRRGPLRTSAGRMSASGSTANEHDKIADPYETYGSAAVAV
ncbi:hypothetical protein K490DRAFT_69740 [Saccharata proteae CBS 121410]|uniref:Uncharacterized protein n=1 Tax=Saccharata proteae CBS 121410 TaxID=1314787 RepID=A0A9P4HPB6_9PEZI|nr:hypothetical protein K490DRAFT_69740 [Saccharata proteae CBS 121410]